MIRVPLKVASNRPVEHGLDEIAGASRENRAPSTPRSGTQARVSHFGMSDPGRCRNANEDAFLADEGLGLFVVCDGVGGRAFGAFAAKEAISQIQRWVRDETCPGDDEGAAPPRSSATFSLENTATSAQVGIVVRSAMRHASHAIYELAQAHTEYAGMSTTASVVIVAGETAVVGQVGDSRVYKAQGPTIVQLTEDHTLANLRAKQGHVSPERTRKRKSPIVRAIGLRDDVEVDIVSTPLVAGDRLLICSDGLHDYLDGDSVLKELFKLDVQSAARAAVQHANLCGGKDNITALFIEVLGDP